MEKCENRFRLKNFFLFFRLFFRSFPRIVRRRHLTVCAVWLRQVWRATLLISMWSRRRCRAVFNCVGCAQRFSLFFSTAHNSLTAVRVAWWRWPDEYLRFWVVSLEAWRGRWRNLQISRYIKAHKKKRYSDSFARSTLYSFFSHFATVFPSFLFISPTRYSLRHHLNVKGFLLGKEMENMRKFYRSSDLRLFFCIFRFSFSFVLARVYGIFQVMKINHKVIKMPACWPAMSADFFFIFKALARILPPFRILFSSSHVFLLSLLHSSWHCSRYTILKCHWSGRRA